MIKGEKTYEEIEAELEAQQTVTVNPMLQEDEDDDEWKHESQSRPTPTTTPKQSPDVGHLAVTDSGKIESRTKKTTPKPKDRKRLKREVTEKDLAVMEFIARAKLSNSRQIAIATGSSEGMTKKRLAGLRSLGLVQSEEVTGRRLVYFITRNGLVTLSMSGLVDEEEAGPVISKGGISYAEVGHTLAVSQLLAQVVAGWESCLGSLVTVPKAVGYGAIKNGYQINSEAKSWEETFSKKFPKDKLTPQTRGIKWTQAVPKFGPAHSLTARELNSDGHIATRWTHRPDLSLRLLQPDGQTVRVAVEMELTLKESSRLRDTLALYRQNQDRFDRVVWVTNRQAINDRLITLRDQLGMSDWVDIAPLLGANGERWTDSPWKL